MFYEIFTETCKEMGYSPTSVLQQLNISTSKLTAWKNGSMPNSSFVILISEFLGVTTDYLLKGEKEKGSPSPELSDDEQKLLSYFKDLSDIDKGIIIGEARVLSGAVKETLEEHENTIYMDLYELPVSAGSGVYLDNCDKTMIQVTEDELTSEANYALRVSGDSMEPDFHDGDIILIRSQPTVELGEIGIFILDGSGYVKEFGGDHLISHNEQYENIKLSEYSEVYCRGLVLGVLDSSRIV